MRIFKFIEKGIEYDAIECIGPLEYVDAKCVILDNKGKYIILYMENTMYSNRKIYNQIDVDLRRKEYYFNSKLHHDNGLAVLIYNSAGRRTKSEYWLNGIQYNLQKYKIKLRREKIKRLNSL